MKNYSGTLHIKLIATKDWILPSPIFFLCLISFRTVSIKDLARKQYRAFKHTMFRQATKVTKGTINRSYCKLIMPELFITESSSSNFRN